MADSSVRIARPRGEVFAFYEDFGNLPRFLGDVESVERLAPGTWRWVVQGPMGARLRRDVRVTRRDEGAYLAYESVPVLGLKARWEVRFTSRGDGETEVDEVLSAPLGRLGRTALAAVGKHPAEEVAANLRRLKEVLETGTVTCTAHSAPGKRFG
ncbi:SRPBCC family protein [Streptomyces fuscigenes]|uniref:SRPBCC family protein n=1 Tax=Streptomyces fuscigenes TaxID=1528880 RepID=UPI001F167D83|nr:SRPBCC family protein [Streptomyces fuscigenes]MCF3961628.1 SRPBCC family protein [Streptomyces fuscigenes]